MTFTDVPFQAYPTVTCQLDHFSYAPSLLPPMLILDFVVSIKPAKEWPGHEILGDAFLEPDLRPESAPSSVPATTSALHHMVNPVLVRSLGWHFCIANHSLKLSKKFITTIRLFLSANI